MECIHTIIWFYAAENYGISWNNMGYAEYFRKGSEKHDAVGINVLRLSAFSQYISELFENTSHPPPNLMLQRTSDALCTF
jgi:hypothetical protein